MSLTVEGVDNLAPLATAWGEQTARQMLADAGFGETTVRDAPGDAGNAVFVNHRPSNGRSA